MTSFESVAYCRLSQYLACLGVSFLAMTSVNIWKIDLAILSLLLQQVLQHLHWWYRSELNTGLCSSSMVKVQSAKDHRANRLLAALEPKDFVDLEPPWRL
jgi:hypothetical protein